MLAKLPSVSIAPEDRPRMADFASLGEAVFRVHGELAGVFLNCYSAMRRDGVLQTIDASPVGAALVAYLQNGTESFYGTLTDLLDRPDRFKPHGEIRPRSAKGLGYALRRLAPALRTIGFECKSLPKTGGAIRWTIFSRPVPPRPSPAGPAGPASPDPSPWLTVSDRKAGHAGHAGHGLNGLASEKGMPAPTADLPSDTITI